MYLVAIAWGYVALMMAAANDHVDVIALLLRVDGPKAITKGTDADAEALRAAADLRAASALAIHFGTFELADDGQQEAPETLRRLRQDAGLPERAFDIPLFGSGYDFAPLPLASDV